MNDLKKICQFVILKIQIFFFNRSTAYVGGFDLRHDYALIRFDEDLIQSSKDAGYEGKVAIACMNRDLTLDQLAGEACWIAGWGSTTSTNSEVHGDGTGQKIENGYIFENRLLD